MVDPVSSMVIVRSSASREQLLQSRHVHARGDFRGRYGPGQRLPQAMRGSRLAVAWSELIENELRRKLDGKVNDGGSAAH